MGATKGTKDLELWQERLKRSERAYEEQLAKMSRREATYQGDRTLIARVQGDRKRKAAHVRNLTAELIEAQVNSGIPQPKVTAKRKEDEAKAKLIEDMLRGELDRLPFEQINDLMERVVPIQGGACFLVEWDNSKRSHTTIGEIAVTALHPKQVIPQEGVYTGIEDMDYIILKLPQTKEAIKRRYEVDLKDESEAEPEVKGVRTSDSVQTSGDMVTQYIAYYRNKDGGIGLFSWVNDQVLCDYDDYQSRQRESGEKKEKEELFKPITRSDGTVVPDFEEGIDPLTGNPISIPTKIPCYVPNIYPVILQKNVSVYGQFLGDSDVDKIADQQNTVNRLESKIVEKLIKSGSYLVLPDDAIIKADAEDMKVIRPGGPANASMISVKDMEGNISQDMAYLQQVYEEARQTIGITDSFQGRKDTTATSGRAKEFSASQAAGRLESKRIMKNAAYAALFEAMFKFRLAYADEKRPVLSRDATGEAVYEEFNRYDFLEKDAAGAWYWNDQFLFSCDTTAPLANNREAMWQETRQNLQSGAFGDPTQLDTLILFWTKMEMLHYPGAAETKSYLVNKKEQQDNQAAMQQVMVAMPPLYPQQEVKGVSI